MSQRNFFIPIVFCLTSERVMHCLDLLQCHVHGFHYDVTIENNQNCTHETMFLLLIFFLHSEFQTSYLLHIHEVDECLHLLKKVGYGKKCFVVF